MQVTYGDYADRIPAKLFYDLHDLKEAEIERQNIEAKKARRKR